MYELITRFFSSIEKIFSLPEHLIEPISFLPDFLKDALVDSLNLLPFLFIMFLLIEVLERYFYKKRHLVVFFIKKVGPIFGSLVASIPQCGFSVIASTLYTKRILSRGTLICIYLATSDEAIPVLIAEPDKASIIIPIIVIKVILAIIVGYLVDLLIPYQATEPDNENTSLQKEIKGCCNHSLTRIEKIKDFLYHPIKHTVGIFALILLVSIVLGYILSTSGSEALAKHCFINSPLQPLLASIIGLIPNCAISVMLTIFYIKQTISFGALVAGLSSSAGLGLLILLTKNNDKKDTAIIITILVVVSTLVGLAIQYNLFNVNNFINLLGVAV